MKRIRVTTSINAELLEQARNIVAYEHPVRLSHLFEKGLRHVVQQHQKRRGKPFPQRQYRSLPVGRPCN